jgi:hypothetical protein
MAEQLWKHHTMAGESVQRADPVSVSLSELQDGSVPFDALEDAFGPSSLGILMVRDLPENFPELRQNLLSYSSYLANLPQKCLGEI